MSLCLMPRNDGGQRLLSFGIKTNPQAPLNSEEDSFGNTKHVLNIHRDHGGLEIISRSTVDAAPPTPLPGSLGADAWEEVRSWRQSLSGWEFTSASRYVQPSPELDAFVERQDIRPGGDPLESLLRLSDTLYRSFEYAPGSTSAASPIEHILRSRRGVCQDYAHVMIAIARSWSVPARYVSGYFHVTGQEGEQTPQSATHAWVECKLPGLGWAGLDPTNRSLPDVRHVRIAQGRDYHDVPPTRGVLQGSGAGALEVNIQMQRVQQPL